MSSRSLRRFAVTTITALVAAVSLAVVSLPAASASPGDERVITGTVLGAGQPVPGASVRVFTPDGDLVKATSTTGSGSYELGLPEGEEYYLGFFGGVAYVPHYTGNVDTFHPDNRSIQTFEVTTDTTIDATLLPAVGDHSVELSAEVNHGPVGFDPFTIDVDLQRLEGNTWYSVREDLLWKDDDYETTIAGLPEAQYRVIVTDDGYVEDVESVDFAGGTTAIVHGAIAHGARYDLSGVISLDGVPQDIPYEVWKWESPLWQPYFLYGDSDEDGSYSAEATPGYYSIHFSPNLSSSTGAPQYLNGTNTAPADQTQPGVLHVVNADVEQDVALGPLDGSAGSASLTGVVRSGTTDPVAGARIDVTRGYRHYESVTAADGTFTIPSVAAHATVPYTVNITPATDGFIGATRTILLTSALSGDLGEVTLHAPRPVPAGVTFAPSRPNAANGAAVVFSADQPTIKVPSDCTDGDGTVTVQLGDLELSATLLPQSAGTFQAELPAAHPLHGVADVTYNIDCNDPASSSSGAFDLYIDPSSTVIDRYYNSVAGAKVTFLRSATKTGTYTAVPANSPFLTPANRSGSRITGADGLFDFNVTPGWYKIKATVAGKSTTTEAMEVPPGRVDMFVYADKSGAVPPAALAPLHLVGTDGVGDLLSVGGGSWGPNVRMDGAFWHVGSSFRGGGLTHVVDPGETGKLIATVSGVVFRTANVDGLEGRSFAMEQPFEASVGMQKFTKSPVPTISGTPKIRGTLTAKPGTWAPSGATFTYEWFVDGVTQAGSGPTFSPSYLDYGKKVTVRATAHKPGWVDKTSPLSKPTAAVGKGSLIAPTPTITGTVKTGQVLVGHPGAWGPGEAAVDLSWQWMRDGKPITLNGTLTSYTLIGADYGKKISVKITGTPTGPNAALFPAKSKTSAETKVAAAALTTIGTPTISGEVKVGKTLTVDPGTWVPSPDKYTYQWYVGTKAVTTATKTTFVVPASALGKTIYVRATGVKLGYTSGKQNSLATDPVQPGTFDPAPAPSIVGNPWQGSTLKASLGVWGPASGNSFTYSWSRVPTSGSPVVVGTSSTYKVKAVDVGSPIQLTVTASRPGFDSVSTTSLQTSQVLALLTQVQKSRVTGSYRVGGVLTVEQGSVGHIITNYVGQMIAIRGHEKVLTGFNGTRVLLTLSEACNRVFYRETVTVAGFAPTTFETEHKKVSEIFGHC